MGVLWHRHILFLNNANRALACSLIWQENLTAKNSVKQAIVSPFFGINDFAFARV